MLVFDATPIIYLAKVGKLHLIENISEKKVIPGSVFEEVVVKGKEAGRRRINLPFCHRERKNNRSN